MPEDSLLIADDQDATSSLPAHSNIEGSLSEIDSNRHRHSSFKEKDNYAYVEELNYGGLYDSRSTKDNTDRHKSSLADGSSDPNVSAEFKTSTEVLSENFTAEELRDQQRHYNEAVRKHTPKAGFKPT